MTILSFLIFFHSCGRPLICVQTHWSGLKWIGIVVNRFELGSRFSMLKMNRPKDT